MEASAVPRLAPTGVVAFASPGLLRVLSDDRLVALVRDGNANAFEALYDRHHRAILSFCRHMLGGADDAEDAVQQTFLSAYKDLVSSRKPISLRAWLFTIARNRCVSILRARHDRTELELDEQPTDGLAVQVQVRQDLRDLVIDINQLPDDQRAALVLAEIGALSHDEIGSVIGVPKAKVKALVFQARESLLASRAARDTDCVEIREQLATMRGGALRRTTLRRHLRECKGCREYRREVEGQRRRIAVILPVLPTIALREAILGATAGGGVTGAGLAGGGLVGTTSLLKGIAGKGLVAAMVAAVGTTGTILVVHDFRLHGVADPRHPRGTTTSVNGLGRHASPLVAVTSTAKRDVRSVTGGRPAASTRARASVLPGNSTAATKALVHSLTGQLSDLLNPISPRPNALRLGAGAPQTVTPVPVDPVTPVATPVATPVSPTSTGVLSSQPTPDQPVAAGDPAVGSPASAPPPGQPGSGPSVLSATGPAPDSSGATTSGSTSSVGGSGSAGSSSASGPSMGSGSDVGSGGSGGPGSISGASPVSGSAAGSGSGSGGDPGSAGTAPGSAGTAPGSAGTAPGSGPSTDPASRTASASDSGRGPGSGHGSGWNMGSGWGVGGSATR